MDKACDHSRRSLRFGDRDYRARSSYIVTLCTYLREPLFGVVVGDRMALSGLGQIAEAAWLRTGSMRPEVALGAYVVMPDHMHAILHIDGSSRTGKTIGGAFGRPKGSLGSVIAGFKASCTSQINILRGTPNARVWQRNYWESYIRSEQHLVRATQYIEHNPLNYRGAHRRISP